MELLFKIGQLILMLSILVILHEFGHYIPAKIFKTKIEKFFLFFDVKFALFSKKIGDTTWGIGWLPLGGYVKIAGMVDESMDREQMAKPAQPWEFRSKPAWQRLIIMTGGVIVNFLLAWFVFTCLLIKDGDSYIPISKIENGIVASEIGEQIGFKTGDKILSIDGKPVLKFTEAMMGTIFGDQVTVEREGKKVNFTISDESKNLLFSDKRNLGFISPRYPSQIGYVKDGSLADEIGLKLGDKVISTNGKPTSFWREWALEIVASRGDTIKMTLERSGQLLQKQVFLPEAGILGVSPEMRSIIVTDNFSFLEAIPAGLNKTVGSLTDQIKNLKVILNTKTGAYKEVKGPIGMVEIMSPEWNASYFWGILAMLSVWLAFMNILPIPALDGGHVMFLLYEIISGKKPSQRVLETGQIVGFVFILTLMVFIFGHDIWNLFNR